jgi:hypothetical protein
MASEHVCVTASFQEKQGQPELWEIGRPAASIPPTPPFTPAPVRIFSRYPRPFRQGLYEADRRSVCRMARALQPRKHFVDRRG